MDEMIAHMLQYAHLNQQQTELIKSKLVAVHLKKGDYFSEAGKFANRVGFILGGLFRVCYYSREGEEFTRCFVLEKNFVADMNSFYNGTACAEYVEALTDCSLVVLSKEDFMELAETIIPWNDIFSKVMTKALMRKVQESRVLISQEGKERYHTFLTNYPGLVNRIPLSIVANYLGVTQSSLSRIRKNTS